MLLSDLIGGGGGILIAVPAVKDQIYRFGREREERKAEKSPWPGLRKASSRAWERRRNDYDGYDSFTTMLGALGIALSFVLKTVRRINPGGLDGGHRQGAG